MAQKSTSGGQRPGKLLKRDFFDRSVHDVAPDLIGATMLFDGAGGIIVEVEAYHHTDPASHSYVRRTPRNGVMFGPPGHAYVYRSYGMHWCLNFVCLTGSAVLLRAIEPIWGLQSMIERRGTTTLRLLCSGPGRLCQALAVDGTDDGIALRGPRFTVIPLTPPPPVETGPRIGISKGIETPWRYGLKGSAFTSRKFV